MKKIISNNNTVIIDEINFLLLGVLGIYSSYVFIEINYSFGVSGILKSKAIQLVVIGI